MSGMERITNLFYTSSINVQIFIYPCFSNKSTKCSNADGGNFFNTPFVYEHAYAGK